MSQATVSVVIPTYYRNNLLADAIESVEQLAWTETELIVVDGSGEGHASSVVDKKGVTYLDSDEEISVTAARNRGIEEAKGSYVQLLDDDDQLVSNKFTKQIAIFRDDPDTGVVYSGGTYSTGEEFRPNPNGSGNVLRQALSLELHGCVTSTMLFRQEVLHEIQPLPDTSGADDTHWKVELAQRTQFDFVDEPLVIKHVAPDSRGKQVGNIRALEEFFKRYEDVYEQFPKKVYRMGRANYYNYRANTCLRRRGWSPTAIYCYGHAFRHQPSLRNLGLCLSAVFGSKGVDIAQRIWSHI